GSDGRLRADYQQSLRLDKVEGMTRSLSPLNRFFVSPDFSVYYRRAKHLHWQNQASTGYSLLTVLDGNVEYSVDGQRAELPRSASVVFEPNVAVSAGGNQAELLFLTFSASVVLQCAASMHLIPPNATVTFTRSHLNQDNRLNALLAEFAVELADDKPGREIVMRALVEQVMVHVLRNYSQPRLSD